MNAITQRFLIILILSLCLSCKSTIEKKTYYPDGKIKEHYFLNKKDTNKFEGKLVKYFENGKISETVNYKDGKQNGTRTIYFQSGNVNIIENYSNGLFEGKYLTFNENGSKDSEGQYKKNSMTGLWKFYFENPKNVVKEEVTFEKNMENGPFKEYHTNGKIYAEGVYKNEAEEGIVKIFDTLGVHIKDVYYEKGFPKKVVDKK